MKNKNSSSGLSFSSVLTIVFIVLKMVGVIDWSWWWVLSPTLISLGLGLLFIGIYIIYLKHEEKKYDSIIYGKRKKDKWKF